MTILVWSVVVLYLLFAYAVASVGGDSMTVSSARKGIIWPLLALKYFGKCVLFILNEIVAYFLLVAGYKYTSTTMYKYISDNLCKL